MTQRCSTPRISVRAFTWGVARNTVAGTWVEKPLLMRNVRPDSQRTHLAAPVKQQAEAVNDLQHPGDCRHIERGIGRGARHDFAHHQAGFVSGVGL